MDGPTPVLRRVRLKADGRLVELTADGRERDLPERIAPVGAAEPPAGLVRTRSGSRLAGRLATLAPPAPRGKRSGDAAYARSVRAATRLTQAEFAARIGVPIETVRNWEQGKRAPRGPARALLKLIERAPDLAFSVLAPGEERR
ncbi:MAG: helix-turn-helix domain-containing protein [Pseudorhodoplanes sp.]|nr:MAG: helix-turn-helix domain-containing protein [Pseudorhodoplanes sp.]MBZ0141004.1 helix-turn-helix domain-containing protein [Pseudorhodoplanes sp.]